MAIFSNTSGGIHRHSSINQSIFIGTQSHCLIPYFVPQIISSNCSWDYFQQRKERFWLPFLIICYSASFWTQRKSNTYTFNKHVITIVELVVCKDLHAHWQVINIWNTFLSPMKTEPAHNRCYFNFLKVEIASKIKWCFYQSMEVGENWLLNTN